jgi:hypothetical protein
MGVEELRIINLGKLNINNDMGRTCSTLGKELQYVQGEGGTRGNIYENVEDNIKMDISSCDVA